MKVVLVSGASGFLGRHAVGALLDRGNHVHAISRRPPGVEGCIWHEADLFEEKLVQGILDRVQPTHLLHLAWETAHGQYWTSPENLRWVEATLWLCRQFVGGGGRRIVGAGTCAEYTWDDTALGERPIEEGSAPRAPARLYGVAKNATYEVLASYCHTVGVGFAWGRLFFPYGPGERRPTLIPSIIQALREGRPALCTHGRQRRDFIHVKEAGAAFAALLESPVSGAVNIASGTATSIGDVANRLGALLGRPDLIRLGALEARPNEPSSLVASVRRLREEVSFAPRIALEDGLRETVEWWTQQPA